MFLPPVAGHPLVYLAAIALVVTYLVILNIGSRWPKRKD